MLKTPIASIAFVVGLALIALGLLWRGLPTIPRTACFIFGFILSGFVLFKSNLFEQPKQPSTEQQQTINDKGRDLGTAVTNPKQNNAPPPTAAVPSSTTSPPTATVPSSTAPPPGPTVPSSTASPTVAQAPEPNPPPPKIYSQVLPIRFVDNQKDFAQKLRNYLAAKGYSIKTTNTNFSEITGDNRQKAGTIRIIYKSTAKDFEPMLANTIRAQFPTMPLVETLNDGARADLQVQLW
jgi:hypothetical protein